MTVQPPASHFADAAGRTIHYHVFGDGPPVVLLHGGGPGASGYSNYSRNVEALAARFRVYVPDLPGYGRSTKGLDMSDPFGDLAAGLKGFFDEVGIETADLVGNSLGGGAALRFALEHPDRAGRLVLMGPGGGQPLFTPMLTTPLMQILTYYLGGGADRGEAEGLHPATGVRSLGGHRGDDGRALRRQRATGHRRQSAAAAGAGGRPGPAAVARSAAGDAGQPDPDPLGRR
jgi:pimeloyl-ACP methyl ester carboxylesterase